MLRKTILAARAKRKGPAHTPKRRPHHKRTPKRFAHAEPAVTTNLIERIAARLTTAFPALTELKAYGSIAMRPPTAKSGIHILAVLPDENAEKRWKLRKQMRALFPNRWYRLDIRVMKQTGYDAFLTADPPSQLSAHIQAKAIDLMDENPTWPNDA